MEDAVVIRFEDAIAVFIEGVLYVQRYRVLECHFVRERVRGERIVIQCGRALDVDELRVGSGQWLEVECRERFVNREHGTLRLDVVIVLVGDGVSFVCIRSDDDGDMTIIYGNRYGDKS